MAVGNTTRFGLTTWSSGDDPMGRAQFQNDNQAVENLGAVWRTGTLAARPAPDASSAARSFYYNTSDSILYFTDGSAWKPLNSLGASGDAYTVVAGSVTTPQGTSSSMARADHKHAVSTAAATTVTNSNSEGTSTSLARADHNHAIGNGSVGVDALAANSVTKAKIDASAIVKASTGMIAFDTTNGFSLNASTTYFESVGNSLSIKASSITTTELAGSIGRAKLATDIVKASTGGLSFDTTNGLSVNTSTTVGLSANTLIVNTNSIGPTHLTSAVAGDGLSGGNGTALAVNVDSSTIETNSDTLRVKDGGITVGKLAANAVTKDKVDAGSIVKATTGALSFDTTNGFAVNYDDTTIGVSSNSLQVKNSSITSTKVDGTVYARGTVTGFSATTAKIHISNGTNPSGTAGDVLFKF